MRIASCDPVLFLVARETMSFGTLLFAEQLPRDEDRPRPACFPDLFLDQITAAAIKGREDYGLAPTFYRPLESVEDIGFRQAIARDLETLRLRAAIDRFGLPLSSRRASRSSELTSPHPARRLSFAPWEGRACARTAVSGRRVFIVDIGVALAICPWPGGRSD